MSLMPKLGLSTTQVSGAVAAAIIAASIGLAAIGVLTYVRRTDPFKVWLVPYIPTAQYGGIFLYSNVIWGALWVGLFFALRHRESAGTLRTWLLFFLASLAVGTGFAEASLNWNQLSTVMQLGVNGPEITGVPAGQATGEVSVKILEGSSIQGNPGYEPGVAIAGKEDLITWVNADVAPHTVTSGAGTDDPKSGQLFDSGSLGQGQKFSMDAKSLGGAGSYDYYCTVHPFMRGEVTIR